MLYIRLLTFFFPLFNLQAQNSQISGNIKYQVVFYGSDDSLKNGTVTGYELVYQNHEISYFYVKHIKTLNDNGTVFVSPNGDKRAVVQYQNLGTKTLINVERVTNTSYLVKDTMSVIPWKLSKNTKKIQNIECFSAQAEYRGRVWTAWYAPSIPISSGPWKLYGLPGIILEAEDIKHSIRFVCTSVTIPSEGEIEIPQHKDKQKNINPITTKQFAELCPSDISNFEKMLSEKDTKINIGVSSIEIYEFEKDLAKKRFQQKLSDIPKK